MIDIIGRNPYPSGNLSNFAPHSFVFDSIECASMEGLVQSIKTRSRTRQLEICSLKGKAAKLAGTEHNEEWLSSQTLWWNNTAMPRESSQYQAFIRDAFDALATNQSFIRALIATVGQELDHTIGNEDPTQTVLTRLEFIRELYRIRARFDEEWLLLQ